MSVLNGNIMRDSGQKMETYQGDIFCQVKKMQVVTKMASEILKLLATRNFH